MAEKEKNPFGGLKLAAQKGLASIDVEALKEKAAEATGVLKDKAVEVKEAAVAAKDEIADKLTELDRMLQGVVTEYNDAYTIMNDKGVQLFVERSRAVDSISFVESLVNSIANRPKSFDAEFEEVHTNRKKFTDSCEFANLELQEARKAATGAGAGLAAGASVAFMAPTAAMWIATTFGTASTGAAISTLWWCTCSRRRWHGWWHCISGIGRSRWLVNCRCNAVVLYSDLYYKENQTEQAEERRDSGNQAEHRAGSGNGWQNHTYSGRNYLRPEWTE